MALATTRRRRALALAAPVVLGAGLAARFGLPGAAADAAGSVLYTALVYVLLGFAWPQRPALVVGIWALLFSVAIELFQLTPVPADLANWWRPLRLVFGTSFAATDLPGYAVGAALAAAADARLRGLSPSVANRA